MRLYLVDAQVEKDIELIKKVCDTMYTDVSEEHVTSIFRGDTGSGNASVARKVVMRPK
jgi:hypothetical protein